MNLSPEKQKIIEQDGSVLVTANPGTGKTLLLAGKYINLLKRGVSPDKILCLTFTEKAKTEMSERIIKAIREEKLKFDFSKLNVFTFHSYALQNLEREDIISSNLLRYSIYRYMTDNDILDYGEEYLIETIVPKMENLIRYLKNFGILPGSIDLNEVKSHIVETEKYSKEELDAFAEHFINIFRHYEEVKSRKGYDYGDLLIEFLRLKKCPKFDYVLVDELQDANSLEADIVLKSCNKFFVVGDKKQAIFGFQGGSILNFAKFENGKSFVLSDNFRSTNEILSYAREYFSRSQDEKSKDELSKLRNPENPKGTKPMVYSCSREDKNSAVCELVQSFKDIKKIAVIARTNNQLMQIGNELKARGISFSATSYATSSETKQDIIYFLRGMLSNGIVDIKNAMFTPFFPIKIQKAFEISANRDITIDEISSQCPEFARLREKVKTTEDIYLLFKEIIVPVAISYGKEHLSVAMELNNSLQEAFNVMDDLSIENLAIYLKSSDILSEEPEVNEKVTLTTVHKAKGRQFDTVIYVPSKSRENSNFQDTIVEAILESKSINAKEELEEEGLRVNFVAFTRAMKELIIVSDKPEEYINDYSDIKEIEAETISGYDLTESRKKAYSLFLNGDFDKAKEILSNKEKWITEYVKKHFASLKHISPTSLCDNAYDYLIRRIIKIDQVSKALQTGSSAHDIAECLARGQEIEVSEEMKPFKDNTLKIIGEIKQKFPEFVEAEEKVEIPLKDILATDDDIKFFGIIDAIFKNKESYLIVDWKTDRDDSNDSKYRQQLDAYRRAYSVKHEIPLDKIKTAIGFIGLRSRIKNGKVDFKYDEKLPGKTAFETFTKKVNLLLSWKNDTNKFFQDLMETEQDDVIWRSVVEEYKKETK